MNTKKNNKRSPSVVYTKVALYNCGLTSFVVSFCLHLNPTWGERGGARAGLVARNGHSHLSALLKRNIQTA